MPQRYQQAFLSERVQILLAVSSNEVMKRQQNGYCLALFDKLWKEKRDRHAECI